MFIRQLQKYEKKETAKNEQVSSTWLPPTQPFCVYHGGQWKEKKRKKNCAGASRPTRGDARATAMLSCLYERSFYLADHLLRITSSFVSYKGEIWFTIRGTSAGERLFYRAPTSDAVFIEVCFAAMCRTTAAPSLRVNNCNVRPKERRLSARRTNRQTSRRFWVPPPASSLASRDVNLGCVANWLYAEGRAFSFSAFSYLMGKFLTFVPEILVHARAWCFSSLFSPSILYTFQSGGLSYLARRSTHIIKRVIIKCQ